MGMVLDYRSFTGTWTRPKINCIETIATRQTPLSQRLAQSGTIRQIVCLIPSYQTVRPFGGVPLPPHAKAVGGIAVAGICYMVATAISNGVEQFLKNDAQRDRPPMIDRPDPISQTARSNVVTTRKLAGRIFQLVGLIGSFGVLKLLLIIFGDFVDQAAYNRYARNFVITLYFMLPLWFSLILGICGAIYVRYVERYAQVGFYPSLIYLAGVSLSLDGIKDYLSTVERETADLQARIRDIAGK